MADYERGAYTPQTDAPLAFDARRPSERRPMPMALIGSAVVLVVLLGGVAMVYRSGVRHAGEAPRPVGEPVMSVKTAPQPEPAKPPPANLDVYNDGATPQSTQNTAAAAPAFAAPAEQPAPRPVPKPSTLAMLAKPTPPQSRRPTPAESEAAQAVAEAPLKPAAKAHAATPLDQSELAAAGMTRASAPAAAASDEAPATTPHAAPIQTHAALTHAAPVQKAQAPAAAEPAGSVVQIGAFSSDALAHKEYGDVASAMSGQMAGKTRHIQPLERDGKTLFRTWVSGFASHADARTFCEALKAKGKICIVKG